MARVHVTGGDLLCAYWLLKAGGVRVLLLYQNHSFRPPASCKPAREGKHPSVRPGVPGTTGT